MKPQLHIATDRRCYDGAYCSDLQREIDSRVSFINLIKEKYKDFRCTYFPLEGKYMAFVGVNAVSWDMFSNYEECLEASWNILMNKEKQ